VVGWAESGLNPILLKGTADAGQHRRRQWPDGWNDRLSIETQTRRTGVNPLLTLLTASMGCTLTVLDTNIVAIVLPSIARDLGASFADVEWVISSYVLCFASLLLPAGAIADRLGRRRIFLVGIAIFALASLLCALAWSAAALYLARAFQGVGAAFLLAPALAIIGHSFHEESERNRAWAIWGGMMGLTMVLAPIIGGVVAFALGWRWAFNINVPICVLLAGAVLMLVDESKDDNARRLDPAGILLFAASMFGLTAGLINGQAHGWGSTSALASFGAGLLGALAFVIVESRQHRPMLDLTLFRNQRFIGAVLAMFAYAFCTQVMASLLPLFLQNGLGRTPLQAGFAMLPFALAMLALPYVGRRLGHTLTSRQVLVLGLAVAAVGNALTSWGAHLGVWPIVMVGMAVLGSGGGLLNGETQKAIMGTVTRDRAGMASGISTTSRFSGILLGFAVLSGVLATKTRSALTSACMGAGVCDHAQKFADAVVAGDFPQAVAGMEAGARALAMEQARLAYSGGFSAALLVAAVIAGVSAVLVGLLMRGRITGNAPRC
jgi:EmrB/QacA subfamily drug resistance transporter